MVGGKGKESKFDEKGKKASVFSSTGGIGRVRGRIGCGFPLSASRLSAKLMS